MAGNAVKGPHSGLYERGPVTSAAVHLAARPQPNPAVCSGLDQGASVRCPRRNIGARRAESTVRACQNRISSRRTTAIFW